MVSLQVEHLSMRYERTYILRDFALRVQDGEILVLLGESGCGKSTLLKIISGIISPETGTVYLGDQNISYAPPQKRGVGYVPQAQVLFPHMTIRQNISFGLKFQDMEKSDQDAIFDEIVSLTELQSLLDRYPHEISGGQQQRVALARAMVVHPKILLLDEPLSSIDSFAREKLALMIRRLNKTLHTTVIYVTHSHEEAQLIGDRVAIIAKGEIIQSGSFQTLYSSPQSYLVAKIMGKTNCWPILSSSKSQKLQSNINIQSTKKDIELQTPFGRIILQHAPESELTGFYIPPPQIDCALQTSVPNDSLKEANHESLEVSKHSDWDFSGQVIHIESPNLSSPILFIQVPFSQSFEIFKVQLASSQALTPFTAHPIVRISIHLSSMEFF